MYFLIHPSQSRLAVRFTDRKEGDGGVNPYGQPDRKKTVFLRLPLDSISHLKRPLYEILLSEYKIHHSPANRESGMESLGPKSPRSILRKNIETYFCRSIYYNGNHIQKKQRPETWIRSNCNE